MVGLAVEVVVDCCFVGWKEERARKAARKLERKGRGGCWVGEGMVGCEASLEGAMVVALGFVRGRGFLLCLDPINESFFPFSAV